MLLENSTVEKVQELDSHVGVAISGLAADARNLVDHARVECANHKVRAAERARRMLRCARPPPACAPACARARALLAAPRLSRAAQFTYDEPLRVESLTQSICDLKMSFGEGGDDDDDEDGGDGGGGSRRKAKMSRPFGVSLLVAGCDARGPQLYCTDPSGTYVCWDAQAIGNGSEAARTILQERYAKTLSVDAAAVLIVRVLCETMEEKVRQRARERERARGEAAARLALRCGDWQPKRPLPRAPPPSLPPQITSANIELASVTPEHGYRMYTRAQLDAVIAKAQEEMAAEGAR